MEGVFLEWFDIQPLEIIYRLYSEGQLFDLIFPKSDLKSVEFFSELFEKNTARFTEATQAILKEEALFPLGATSSILLKAHCRGKVTRKTNLEIKIKTVTFQHS